MQKHRLGKLGAAGALVLALAVSTTAFIASQAGADKVCPIRFSYKHVSELENGLAAHIEMTNARLALVMANFRGMKTLDDALVKKIEGDFSKTYLRNPVLRKTGGKTYEGWNQVAPALWDIVNSQAYVNVQTVDVLLEYLPARSRPDPDIDYRATIETQLACAPNDCTTIRGGAAHRTLCTWEP